jgi:hypothetical protein
MDGCDCCRPHALCTIWADVHASGHGTWTQHSPHEPCTRPACSRHSWCVRCLLSMNMKSVALRRYMLSSLGRNRWLMGTGVAQSDLCRVAHGAHAWLRGEATSRQRACTQHQQSLRSRRPCEAVTCVVGARVGRSMWSTTKLVGGNAGKSHGSRPTALSCHRCTSSARCSSGIWYHSPIASWLSRVRRRTAASCSRLAKEFVAAHAPPRRWSPTCSTCSSSQLYYSPTMPAMCWACHRRPAPTARVRRRRRRFRSPWRRSRAFSSRHSTCGWFR